VHYFRQESQSDEGQVLWSQRTFNHWATEFNQILIENGEKSSNIWKQGDLV
jgi:hypothetical protein